MPGAFTLVIETSTPHASIALIGQDGVLEQCGFCSDRNHNAMLFEPLQELLERDSHREIGLVLVGSGPGSYSGTRVGIAAAQGVAIAMGCPAIAVPSILAVPSAMDGASCVAIGDARRGSYWSARMENHRLIGEPELCDIEELETIVSQANEDGVAVFSFEEPSRFPLTGKPADCIHLEFPEAGRLWKAWLASDEATRRRWAEQIPQPLYLKPPHITPGKRPALQLQRDKIR